MLAIIKRIMYCVSHRMVDLGQNNFVAPVLRNCAQFLERGCIYSLCLLIIDDESRRSDLRDLSHFRHVVLDSGYQKSLALMFSRIIGFENGPRPG
jgi:hypothetical protein